LRLGLHVDYRIIDSTNLRATPSQHHSDKNNGGEFRAHGLPSEPFSILPYLNGLTYPAEQIAPEEKMMAVMS
jgi:hypothetical protein